jgi:hypothetical protein
LVAPIATSGALFGSTYIAAELSRPTAVQLPAVGHEIALRLWATGDAWMVQLAPLLVVATIVAPAPTAKQVLAVGHEMPFRSCVVGEVCVVHVIPPLVVATIVPL